MDVDEDSIEAIEVTSDSEDSSSDDGEEKALIAKAEELERQISDNKYLYDVHLELVNLYRKLGDLKSMRMAYERFHVQFPLTPRIWLTWISAEKEVATSEGDIKNILQLFDKAVEDYLSVDLWVEYAQYSIGASNLDTTRSILERGVTAAGLHCADGSLLWDTLRQLELAHLSLAEENSEQWKDQVARIVEVFRRQLSVPLMGMENTYKEWQSLVENLPNGDSINKEPIEWGYQKALKTLKEYKKFEDQIVKSSDESELLKLYREYVKVVDDPSTCLCIYERGVAQMCLNSDIWLDYCSYALKLGELAHKVSTRALRNCTWSPELWVLRLRILEHLGRDPKEVLACFETGIGTLGVEQGTDLWLTYLEYTNRTSDDKEKTYKLFNQAAEQLRYTRSSLGVCKFYARLLAKNGNMPEARKVWNKDILKNSDNKKLSNLWLEFVNLELQYGEAGHVRSLFQKAVSSDVDLPRYIADEWLLFERQFGGLQDVLKCVEKCRGLNLKYVEEGPSQEIKGKGKKRSLDQDSCSNVKRARSNPNKGEQQQPQPKKKVPIVKDPKITVFISNLYPSITDKRLQKLFPNAENIEIVTDRLGKSRCYGYVQFRTEEEVAHALARDRELLDNRPMFISNCKPDRNERKAAFKYSGEPESNKLFIRGLPVNKTKEDIEEIYKKFGALSVRLVLHKSGQPKGLAYVEFADDEKAAIALKETDQMTVGNHTITVAISAPPVKTGPGVAGSRNAAPAIRQHAKSRLQVPLIPRTLQVKKDGGSNGTVATEPKKSNEDFRKMLLNK